MVDLAVEITSVNIEDELKQSYLDYAMSVIVGRALPDVRDGLKPVHRRVLFAMGELNNDWNKNYKKSARIVGDVIGKYHPHGEGSVYDALVRMAQNFSMRYMLVDGQGNFGSIDGDPPAAMRYTEVRMAKIAHSLVADIEKDTVDFQPNYDETEFQPIVFPSRLPNLLINGGTGIAVGMATNIPPHNITEVINTCLAIMDNSNISVEEIMAIMPGPDFPTRGIINGRSGIIEAYRTGKGRIHIRGRAAVEENNKGKSQIIIRELPYQVNKARLIEKIAEMVKEKKIEGITALRDESDKQGMRVVIELRKGESGDVILNNLYSQTQLQTVYGINMVALDEGQPKIMSLKQMLNYFLEHRCTVVTRRTNYELRKARSRAHILEGLGIALVNLESVIELIKASANPQEAKANLLKTNWQPGIITSLMDKVNGYENDDLSNGLKDDIYKLSEVQAQAILDLKLHRLTGLEQDKIINEFKEIIDKIAELLAILADKEKLNNVIREELIAIKESFGDERQTEICSSQQDLSTIDLITEEDMVVTLSYKGYIKTQPITDYQAQHRGGRGKSATAVREEDFISQLLIASTHDTLLCFSSAGKVYWLKVYQLPVASRIAKGRPIINLLPLSNNEHISAILPLRDYCNERTVFMATCNGTVKRVALDKFQRPRSSGIIAIDLDDNDKLIGVEITNGNQHIMLCTDEGKAIRFKEQTVRTMGRNARGVRGIKLKQDHKVISLIVLEENGAILTATRNGYGKRTATNEYSTINRGGQGVISIQTTERNGNVIGAVQVFENDELMLISDQGVLVRTKISEISQVGRNTQGVTLINLASNEHLVGIQRIVGDNSEIGMKLQE